MSGRDWREVRRACVLVLGFAAVALVTACGGDADVDSPPTSAERGAADVDSAPQPTDAGTAAAPAEGGDLVAQGRRVFLGQEAGAICVTCHGQDAKGVAGLGPDLTDGNWLHVDGSIESIENLIRTGVMQPKEVNSVMPPYGGVPFSDEHLHAVATYISSLNQ